MISAHNSPISGDSSKVYPVMAVTATSPPNSTTEHLVQDERPVGPRLGRQEPMLSPVQSEPRKDEASGVMHPDVLSVSPEVTLREAAQLLAHRKISGVPVAVGGEPVGWLSQSDLVNHVSHQWARSRQNGLFETADTCPSLTRVGDVASPFCYFATEDATIKELLSMVFQHDIDRIPITRGGQLVGIVEARDLFSSLVERNESSS